MASSNRFFVRTAGERDVAAMRALLVETWHDTYDSIYGVERVTAITDDWHSLRALQARIAGPNAEVLVADDGARIGGVAYASAPGDGKMLRLHQLYVLPALQGRGIGGMLLDEILDSFPDAKRVRLEVEEQNARARAFYAAHGFVEAGATADCGGKGSAIPALVYERRLSTDG